MKLRVPDFRAFYSDARHIMGVSYKPDLDTFKKTIKIVLVGILILGIMGYLISKIIGLVIGSQ